MAEAAQGEAESLLLPGVVGALAQQLQPVAPGLQHPFPIGVTALQRRLHQPQLELDLGVAGGDGWKALGFGHRVRGGRGLLVLD